MKREIFARNIYAQKVGKRVRTGNECRIAMNKMSFFLRIRDGSQWRCFVYIVHSKKLSRLSLGSFNGKLSFRVDETKLVRTTGYCEGIDQKCLGLKGLAREAAPRPRPRLGQPSLAATGHLMTPVPACRTRGVTWLTIPGAYLIFFRRRRPMAAGSSPHVTDFPLR